MKRACAAGLACLMVAGCQTATAVAPPTPAYRDLGPAIREMGYDEVLLPSTGYGPGSLVTSRKGSGGVKPPLRLAYICSPEDVHFVPKLQVNPAASADVAMKLGGAFNLGVSVSKMFNIGAEADYVEDVTLSLSDVTVEEVALSDLVAIVKSLGPSCTELLDTYRARNKAYQTLKALRATLNYHVTFKQGASADVKNAVIQSLNLNLGANAQRTGDSSVVAKGLYLGLDLEKLGGAPRPPQPAAPRA